MERFLKAQEVHYTQALSEIKNGRKSSHWIWYIFPQLAELGRSSTAKYYGIKDFEEAREYISHPLLCERLVEISEALLDNDCSAVEILGHTDAMKVRSCMTLFHIADPLAEVFVKVIDKFYGGQYDEFTLDIIKEG
ncbi:MAG: DUF1810 domain-containing protein [Ruminococcus sp.]|nr:DUF1810 domain-containing protein [Ruminococcus sp.]